MPSQESKDCGRKHDYVYQQPDNESKSKKVTDSELDAIIDRLFIKQKKSRGGCEGNSVRNDENKKKTQKEVDDIVERLFTMKTEAMKDHSDDVQKSEMSVSKKVKSGEVENIVDRLYTTHTACSEVDKKTQKPQNVVSKKTFTENEMKEIYQRLLSTHTKSSAGGSSCKQLDAPKTPGLGQKMLPIIEGLETRFLGRQLTDEQAAEIMHRLLTTQTGASKARKDFPKILLYPERTILHNNTDRIRCYQESGTMTRQKELARREKWFN